jgi:hypothetical protein
MSAVSLAAACAGLTAALLLAFQSAEPPGSTTGVATSQPGADALPMARSDVFTGVGDERLKLVQPLLVRRATDAIGQSRYEDGLRWAHRAMVADPSDANACLAAASALSGLGDPEGASALLREAAGLIEVGAERDELLALAATVFPGNSHNGSLVPSGAQATSPSPKQLDPDDALLEELDQQTKSVATRLDGVRDSLGRMAAPQIDPDALDGAARVGEATQSATARADAAARQTREQWGQALAQLSSLNNAMQSAVKSVEAARGGVARGANTPGGGGGMVQTLPPSTKPPPPPREGASQRECFESERDARLWAAEECERQGKSAAAAEQRRLAAEAQRTIDRLGATPAPRFR